ncbi:unnamed protein product [Caretta caretta]
MTGLVLREPELRLVLSAYADDVLLVVQDPGDLARVEACQAIYSAASSARVNWVKSSGLAVGDWRQEKAFDRVDHGYLLSTLQAFGFGPQFVSFLRVLYAFAECLVRLNWTLTEPVSFGRGVRQGCPLSGQLYALAIEPFLCLLRRRMTGLVLREPELRLVLSAYADDVLLVVQDPGDLAGVEACQAIYSAASSTRVNWVKSSGLAVGDWRQVSSLPPALQTIRWSAGPLLYLGVYLSATHPSPPENWQNLEGGVIERIRRWTRLLSEGEHWCLTN